MGWVTPEELVYNAKGNLLSCSPTTYKIPAITDVPETLNIRYLDNPNNEVSLYRSKAVGEPPLLLGISVWLAVKDAPAICRGDAARRFGDSSHGGAKVLMALSAQGQPVAVMAS